MSYRKALAALEAYEPRALGGMEYEYHGAYCAIGAIAPAFVGYMGSVAYLTSVSSRFVTAIHDLGMTIPEAQELQRINDRNYLDEKDRYQHVLNWLRARVAEEGAQ